MTGALMQKDSGGENFEYLRAVDLEGCPTIIERNWDYTLDYACLNFNIVGEEVDSSGANLSFTDMSGMWLEGADLSGANLSGANLSGAFMRNVDLVGANLTGSDLSGVIGRMRAYNLQGCPHKLPTGIQCLEISNWAIQIMGQISVATTQWF